MIGTTVPYRVASSGVPQESLMQSRTLGLDLTRRNTRATPEEVSAISAQEQDYETGLRKVKLNESASSSGMRDETASFSGVRDETASFSGMRDGTAQFSGVRDGIAPVTCSEKKDAYLFAQEDQEAQHGDPHREVRIEEVRIHPSWKPPRVPPRVQWPEPHEWAGMKGHWHQPTPITARTDSWYYDRAREVLVRFHAKLRTHRFQPDKCVLPSDVPLVRLTGNRRAYARFSDGRLMIEDDVFHQMGGKKLEGDWTGRTEFEVLRRESFIGHGAAS